MSRLRRVTGLVGLAVHRVLGRTRIAPQRVLLSALGVALAVGLMVTVTGISLGLASESVVESEGVQYWIVPENADVQTVAVTAGGVQLGDVHDTSTRIEADSRVQHAIPVLLEVVPVSDATTGEREYVLAVGVVARPDVDVLGLPMDALTPGDPHFANGSYDGPWTGEAVFNDAAASITNASTGAALDLGRGDNRTLTVVNVTEGNAATAIGTAPVAVMHLSELQSITGAASGDQADQILVDTTDRGVRGTLEEIYPGTTVVTRSGLSGFQLSTSNLPLAVAIAAFVTAVVVGVLFVMTLMGLEVSADRRELGTLAAIGFSGTARSLVIAVETLVVTLLGGATGVAIGAVGILAVNVAGSATLGVERVAVFNPLLIAYAVLVSLVIGLLGAIYPVLLGRRADPLEVLGR